MDPMSSKQIIQDNRDYTMFSWSVQNSTNPMHMTKGQGVWFWDGEGNKWLDFSSQLINLNIGHQHPGMLDAIKKQVDELCFAGPSFATEPRAQLGKKAQPLRRPLFVELRQEHQDLDASVSALTHMPLPDQLLIARLKRRKLALRDQIARIEDQLTPDILA